MKGLPPFWRYYGGKNRAAKMYPAPEHDTIVEPFAGAAGYSCMYPHKRVILIDKSPIIAGIWRYLIGATEQEILRLPDIPLDGTVDDMQGAPQEARWLAGFWLNSGTTHPGRTASARSRQLGQDARNWCGWGWRSRERVASQLHAIRHWQVFQGDYSAAPDIVATWHIDPPYNNSAGARYKDQPDSFTDLADWCRTRRGLVMVCENDGAHWLPFRRLADIKSNNSKNRKGRSAEVIWTNRPPTLTAGGQRCFPWGAA